MAARSSVQQSKTGPACAEPGCDERVPPRNMQTGYLYLHCAAHRTNHGPIPEDYGRPASVYVRHECWACTAVFERYASYYRGRKQDRFFCSGACARPVGRVRNKDWLVCENLACEALFYPRTDHARFCSPECHNAWQARNQTERACQNEACGKTFKKPAGDPDLYCSRECWLVARQTPLGHRKRTGDGYIMVYDPGNPMAQESTGYVMEHRKVIGDLLGRPLLPGEEVHHRFEKDDNRLEALELWDKSHPAGQRVEERYRFYKEWIERVERERPLLEAAGVVFHEDGDEVA